MNKVQQDFTKAASRYNEFSHLQQDVGEQLLARLGYFNLSPKVILDIGCGTGVMLEKLKEQYPQAQLIGVDFSLAMCKEGKQAAICADMHQLPIKPHSVDLVVYNFSFQWSQDLPRAFAEVQKIVAPEALFLFAMVGSGSLIELQQSWALADKTPRVHPFYNLHEIGDILYQTGWQEPVTDRDYMVKFYPEVRDILEEFQQLGVTNKHEKRQKGLTGKAAFARFIEHYEGLRTTEGLPLSWQVVYGYARAKQGILFEK